METAIFTELSGISVIILKEANFLRFCFETYAITPRLFSLGDNIKNVFL